MTEPATPDHDAAPSDASARRTLEALATAAAQGDDASFEELHRRLAGGLQRFLSRRLSMQTDVATELAHQTWIEVWRALRAGRYDAQRSRVTTFVYAVGYKLLLRHFRDAGRSGRATTLPDEGLESAAESDDGPDAWLHLSELTDALRDCLHRASPVYGLSPDERAAVLGVAAGESERDLARRLGVAASTINARKRTAFDKLRKCLKKKGFTD